MNMCVTFHMQALDLLEEQAAGRGTDPDHEDPDDIAGNGSPLSGYGFCPSPSWVRGLMADAVPSFTGEQQGGRHCCQSQGGRHCVGGARLNPSLLPLTGMPVAQAAQMLSLLAQLGVGCGKGWIRHVYAATRSV